MTPHEFKDLLDRYSTGKCSLAEQELIDQWFNNIGKNVSNHAEMEALEMLSYNKEAVARNLWNKVKPHQIGTKRKLLSYYGVRIAATVLVLAIVMPVAFHLISKITPSPTEVAESVQGMKDTSVNTIVNFENQWREITLEDGSKVTLKPNSELRFAKTFNGTKREIHLMGEAFFNVTRDEQRPFVVYANEVVTKVLGTSFNIKAYKNEKEITVAVKSGKVSVYTKIKGQTSNKIPSREAVILTPNQQIVYNRENENVLKQLIEKPEIILPKPTLFDMTYDGAQVTKIFEVLEANYGVDIEYDKDTFSDCVLTTTMSDEGLYERIEVICKAINATYTITDAVIIINGQGCK